MILHLNDWKRFPGAIVHKTTKNKSALLLAEIYRAMGVKNFFFHLALHDPTLEHVDPRDPNLDQDTRRKVATEIYYNPWYYFREVAMAPPQTGNDPMPFELNRGNIAGYWLFFNHQDFGWTQPRQTGKSLSADQLWCLLVGIMLRNTEINIVTKDRKLRTKNVERIKKIFKTWPGYLNPITRKDSDNQEYVTVNRWENKLSFMVPQNNEDAAIKLGRGLTSPILGMDEPPFIPHVGITFEAMGPSADAVIQEAIIKGVPYGAIYTTTAGDLSTDSGKYMYELFMGGVFFDESMFDAGSEIALKEIVQSNKKGQKGIVYLSVNHRQLGRTDKWMAGNLERNNSTAAGANKDYFNRWGMGTDIDSPLHNELLDIIAESERQCDHVDYYGSYMVRWYITREEKEHLFPTWKIVCGMDCSDNVKKDATTMCGINVDDLSTVFTVVVNESNIIRFAEFTATLMKRYTNITLIPERKSTGSTVIDMCIIKLCAVGIDPFKRVYNTFVDGADKNSDDYRMAMGEMSRRTQAFWDRVRKYFGYNTAGSGHHARNNLYKDTLQRAARLAGWHVFDQRLCGEIATLREINGRVDHPVSGHDDMVVAWLLGIWMILYSRNLSHYGILSVLSNVKEYVIGQSDNPPPSRQELQKSEDNKLLKVEMQKLLELIENTESDVLTMKYESALRIMASRLSEEYSDTHSLNDLIKEAKDAKIRSAREKSRRSYGRGGFSNWR